MTRESYDFGEFTLDVRERQLSRGAQIIPLAPRALDLLTALVRNAGRLLTKREILDLVWPDSFVEEGILSVHISALRKALREGGENHDYIETVARSGYRFTAVVTARRENGEAHKRVEVAVPPAQPSGPLGLSIAGALIDRLALYPEIAAHPASRRDPLTGRSAAILETRIERAGGGIRLAAFFSPADDTVQPWSGEFHDAAGDVTAVANRIAEAVAAHCGAGEPAAGKPSSVQPRPEVYECIGRGRWHLLASSMFEVPKAVDAFRSAIALDPTYAAAHAGLALACCAQASLRLRPPAEAYAEARDAALRALAMDDSSADAQTALGAVLFWSDWNWTGAERSLQRAIRLNSDHTEAYLLYGQLLEALGRLEEGLRMKQKALERDPFSPLVHLQISLSYWHQRRYTESIEWANKTLALDPKHPHAREHLAGAFWKMGDFDRFLEENIRHAAAHGVPAETFEPVRRAYAAGGRAALSDLFLRQVAAQPSNFPSLLLAIRYGDAGDLDAAFHHLGRAIDDHEPCLVHLAVAPQWDCLRDDPRFEQALERMGLTHGEPCRTA